MEEREIDALDMYKIWLIGAVYGHTKASDSFLRNPETKYMIYDTAKELLKMMPVEAKPLYRGIIENPSNVKNGKIRYKSSVPSVSYSEDFHVASWFADRNSFISGVIKEIRPDATQGYIVEYTPNPEEILFHHKWQGYLRLPELPELHVLCPMTYQLFFNLGTQSEVILKEQHVFNVKKISEYEVLPTSQLEEKYCHPLCRPQQE